MFKIKKIIIKIIAKLKIFKLLEVLKEAESNYLLKKKFPKVYFFGVNTVTDISKFYIGENSNIKSSYIESSGGVKIGKYVHCGINLTIFSSNHNYNIGDKIPYDEITLKKSVIIKDYVWIGANVSIVPGITIGKGSIIGMGSVVTKDVPDYAVYCGNPGKVVKYRDIDHFKKLERNGRFY